MQITNCLANIVTGKVVRDQAVNVDNAYNIGKCQLGKFEDSWPKGFHDTIHKEVLTMATKQKNIKVAGKEIYDTGVIYAQVMNLQKSRDFDTDNPIAHELSPYPTSML